jgi:hypothetical protein
MIQKKKYPQTIHTPDTTGQLLVAARCNIDLQTKAGTTALHLAHRNADRAMKELLEAEETEKGAVAAGSRRTIRTRRSSMRRIK